MEVLDKIFSNQWIINIGTGIFVYIITACISKFILNKASDNEKQTKIDIANREIIKILKPYVVEEELLCDKTIESTIESISRKYVLSNKEVMNVKEICEELVREILESTYVDNQKKKEYIFHLTEIIENYSKIDEVEESLDTLKEIRINTKKYRKIYNLVSMYMLIIVLIITIFVTILSGYPEMEYNFMSSLSEPMQISIIIIIMELALLVPIIYYILMNKIKEKKSYERKSSLINK